MSSFSLNARCTALLMLLLAGCNSGWGEPRDVSRFEHAAIAAAGRLGVFTYKHRIYRPATGWRAFPDGGPSRDVRNENGIATYDLATGEVRVLWRQNVLKSRWLPEGSCSIAAVAGTRVLAVCGGQRRSDYMTDADRFWLDLDNGATNPLPLEDELAARGRQNGVLYLLDPAGTLALVLPLPDHPEGSRKLEPVRELLIRRPSGEYQRVGEIIHYYGFRQGDVHFWSADHRYLVYQPESGSLRAGTRQEYLELTDAMNAGAGLTFGVTYQEGVWRLQLGRKIDGEWRYEILPLTVEEVAGK
jgi:hypothetical protein